MLRRLLFCFMFASIAFSLATAQGTAAVRAALGKIGSKPDTAYVSALLSLSEAITERLPDSALAWSGQALALSRRLDDRQGQARAHYVQATAKLYMRIPDFQGAETALSLARADYDQLHDARGILKCILLESELQAAKDEFLPALTHLLSADSMLSDSLAATVAGRVALQRGDVFRRMQLQQAYALQAYQSARDAFLKQEPKGWELPWAHTRLAGCYLDMQHPDSAAIHFGQAADLWEELEAWQERMHALSAAALAALQSRDTASASKFATNAMRTFPRDTASIARATVLNAQARILLAQANPDSAQRLLRLASIICKSQNDPEILSQTWLNTAAVYALRFDYFNAIRQADSALALADSLRDPRMQVEASGYLANFYNLAGDFRNAQRYQGLQKKAQTAIDQREEALLRMAVMTLQEYRLLEQAQADRKAAAENAGGFALAEKEKWIAVGALGLLGLILLLLFIAVLVRNRRIRNLRSKLQAQVEATESAYEELARFEHNTTRTNSNLEQLVDERTEALKQAVAGLMEANEELDTFIYRASHDLLGPLARLKGLVTMAKTTEPQTEASKTIDLISAVSVYMDRVLRKLILVRDLKFPGTGAHAVDVVAMIQAIEPGLTELPGVAEPEIIIEDWIQKPVMVDERNLRIVLENLLENACIFRKDVQKGNPRIEVNIKKEGRMILIEIADLGIGIPDSIRDRVFEIFFRGSARSKGNGLGLYLVKRAVDGLNGTVQVESKEGAFTKISVRFPELM